MYLLKALLILSVEHKSCQVKKIRLSVIRHFAAALLRFHQTDYTLFDTSTHRLMEIARKRRTM